MEEMVFERGYGDRKRIHRIVYIEYHGRKVHAIVTDEKKEEDTLFDGFCNHFDFEIDCQKSYNFMFYLSGGGGKITELHPPSYINGVTGVTYWIHPEAHFKGKPKNIIQRINPIRYKGNPNPFNCAREIYQQNYCKICGKFYDENYCSAHHSINENDELVYPDGTIEE